MLNWLRSKHCCSKHCKYLALGIVVFQVLMLFHMDISVYLVNRIGQCNVVRLGCLVG